MGNNQTIVGTPGPDVINETGNNDTVYGDFTNQSYSYGPGTYALTLAGGGNIIHMTGNKDTTYGSGRDISISLTGSDNNTVNPSDGASILTASIQYVGNRIVDDGNDSVDYGSIRDLSISLTGGNGNTVDYGGMADITYAISLGSNILTINGNNDVAYGAMRDLALSFTGGNNNSSPNLLAGAATTGTFIDNGNGPFNSTQSTLQVGLNRLVDNGNNNIDYGAMRDLSISLTGGNGNNGGNGTTGGAGIADLDFYSISGGGNSITVSGNNDVVYGAMRDFSWTITGGNNNSGYFSGNATTDAFNTDDGNLDTPSSIDIGANLIKVGDGNNNVIFGAMRDLSYTFNPGSNNSGSQSGLAQLDFNGQGGGLGDTFTAGSNRITVGNGNNDTVYGAMRDLSVTVNPSTNNNGNNDGIGGNIANDSITAGDNRIIVGNGDNATVYGALRDLTITAISGSYNPGGSSNSANGDTQSYDFTSNIIKVGDGNHDVVYGSGRDVEITLTGGSNNGGSSFNGIASMNDHLFYFGRIAVGNGNNDVVYGGMRDLSLTFTGGSNNSGRSTGYAAVDNDASISAGGVITIGDGNNDVVYGGMRNLSLTYVAGNNNTGAADGDAGFFSGSGFLPQPNFDAHGIITAGNGNNDTIYGALKDFTLTLIGGSNNIGVSNNTLTHSFNGSSEDDAVVYQFGSNRITIGDGNKDVVYGSMRDMTINITSGSNNEGNDNGHAQLSADVISMRVDNIHVGNGDHDIVYGSMRDVEISLTGGDNNTSQTTGSEDGGTDAIMHLNKFLTGLNQITVGNGNDDVIFGTLRDFSMTLMGGNNSAVPPSKFVSLGPSESHDQQTAYIFESNKITVGNGNEDVVYGAMRDFTLNLVGGNSNTGSTTGSARVNLDQGFFGKNTIQVGDGSHDVVYGSLQDLSISLTGGNNNIGSAGAALSESTYQTANNTITVGNGDNDVVFGTMEEFSIYLTGGDSNTLASSSGAGLTRTNFFGGSNTITVGNGNHDVVYGDLEELTISLTGGQMNIPGTAPPREEPGEANFSVNHFTFGGNTITVGNGNCDVVFASMDELDISAVQGSNAPAGDATFGNPGSNTMIFANSTVTVGNGNNDTIVADDILDPSGVNLYLEATTPPGHANTITWGNNTIIAGTGSSYDYVFTMIDSSSGQMAMQGVDIITKFTPHGGDDHHGGDDNHGGDDHHGGGDNHGGDDHHGDNNNCGCGDDNSKTGDRLSFGDVVGAATAATLDAVSAFVNIHQSGHGATLAVAGIFNQMGNAAAADFQTAIDNFTTTDPNTGLTLLQDVANYITRPDGGGLAGAVSPGEAPHGGIILAAHTTTDMGSFSQINALHGLTVDHNPIAVHVHH